MTTELRSRHLAIIGVSAVAAIAVYQGVDLMDLKEFFYAIGAYAGLDWAIAKFKK